MPVSQSTEITVTITTGNKTIQNGGYVELGDLVHIAGAFVDSAGTALDPTTVRFYYRVEAVGTTTTLTYPTNAALVKESTGNYYVDIDTSDNGGWYYWRWRGSGAVGQGTTHGSFYVRNTPAV